MGEPFANNCGSHVEARGLIVGGRKVEKRSKWPWLVAFVYSEGSEFFCAGSLISKRHVLGGK